MRLRALKSMLYGTRRLQAGDEFDPRNPRDYKLLIATKQAEAAKGPDPSKLAQMRVPELRELAEERGVELPSGYIRRDDLVELLEEAETDQGDEEGDE